MWPFFRPAQSLAGLRKSGWLASKAKWKPCLLESPHLGGLMLCHKGDRVHKLSHPPTGRRTRVEPVGLRRLLNSCQMMSFLGASWKTQHLQGSSAAFDTPNLSCFHFTDLQPPSGHHEKLTVWPFMGFVSFKPHLNPLRGGCCGYRLLSEKCTSQRGEMLFQRLQGWKR